MRTERRKAHERSPPFGVVGHDWYRDPDGAVCVIEMFDSWIAHGHPSLRGKGEWAGPLIVPI